MGRSKWKGPYIETVLLKPSNSKQKTDQYKASRNSEIVPKFLGITFDVHNGKNYSEVTVTNDMIGHKFGEFVFTRSKFYFKKKKSKK
jgi:small subunit ribosomal protein S19